MKFRPAKLSRDVAPTLRLCPIRTVKPYALMIAPVYVYMRANEKFVAVKSPLDFFTEKDLERLAPLETFYFAPFLDRSLVFREKARYLRTVLAWTPNTPGIEPAPYEKSDAVLRALVPLWGPGISIEPYFVAVFVSELCEILEKDALLRARETSVQTLENAIMISSWSVFIALHCSWLDQAALDRLRKWSFAVAAGQMGVDDVPAHGARDILAVAQTIVSSEAQRIDQAAIRAIKLPYAQRMSSRLERIELRLRDPSGETFTIYGPEGILDAS